MCDTLTTCYDWHATAQDENKELKRQLKLQSHQVDQMKEELTFKDAQVSKMNLARVNVEKDMLFLQVLYDVGHCIQCTYN